MTSPSGRKRNLRLAKGRKEKREQLSDTERLMREVERYRELTSEPLKAYKTNDGRWVYFVDKGYLWTRTPASVQDAH